MKASRTIACVSLVMIAFNLSGCGWSETFISFGGKENGQPIFCISAQPNCASPGAPLRTLQVDEIDDQGKVLRTLWRVDAPAGWGSSGQASKIIYGATPPEWSIVTPPTGLVVGQHYTVNGKFYFSVTRNGLILTESNPAT